MNVFSAIVGIAIFVVAARHHRRTGHLSAFGLMAVASVIVIASALSIDTDSKKPSSTPSLSTETELTIINLEDVNPGGLYGILLEGDSERRCIVIDDPTTPDLSNEVAEPLEPGAISGTTYQVFTEEEGAVNASGQVLYMDSLAVLSSPPPPLC